MAITLTEEECLRYGVTKDQLEGIWKQLDDFKKEATMTPEEVRLLRINELRELNGSDDYELVEPEPNLNAFETSEPNMSEMTDEERKEQLRHWDEDYDRWIWEKHEREEGFEYI